MHSRATHLISAVIGLAAAFAVGYLLLKSAVQLGFISMQYSSSFALGAPEHTRSAGYVAIAQ